MTMKRNFAIYREKMVQKKTSCQKINTNLLNCETKVLHLFSINITYRKYEISIKPITNTFVKFKFIN